MYIVVDTPLGETFLHVVGHLFCGEVQILRKYDMI